MYYSIFFECDYKFYFFIVAYCKNEDGSIIFIIFDKLDLGDIIEVKNGEFIFVDGVLFNGEVVIDYSFVIGEFEFVGCNSGEKVYVGGW